MSCALCVMYIRSTVLQCLLAAEADGIVILYRSMYLKSMSVNNYHTTPRNAPEDHTFHQHCDRSLKSRSMYLLIRVPSVAAVLFICTFSIVIMLYQLPKLYSVKRDTVQLSVHVICSP
jgi:hypothetical protein